jgi:thymidylate kinase
MVVGTYFSVEGVSGAGKSTLVSHVKESHPEFFYYPQSHHKEEFWSFVEREGISLKPLDSAKEQNEKFCKFLDFESDKMKMFNAILSTKSVVSDRDYLSCFSAGYTHAAIQETENETFIEEKIEEFRTQPFFRAPRRFYIDIPVEEALRRKKQRGEINHNNDTSQINLMDYLHVQKEFELDYIEQHESDKTVYIDGTVANDNLMRIVEDVMSDIAW